MAAMWFIISVVSLLAVGIAVAAHRPRRSADLEALGSVSDRWIAEIRASSNHHS